MSKFKNGDVVICKKIDLSVWLDCHSATTTSEHAGFLYEKYISQYVGKSYVIQRVLPSFSGAFCSCGKMWIPESALENIATEVSSFIEKLLG